MRIERIETLAYQAPISQPFGFSQWWFTKRSALLVRVVADDGTEGWGEVFAHVEPTVYGAVIGKALAPVYMGANPLDAGVLWDRAYNRSRPYGQKGMIINALSGIDIALWDLNGKILGQPVSRLLGGRRRERIESYATGLYRTDTDDLPGALAAEARGYAEQGFTAMKLKIGYGFDIDMENLRAVRAAIGQGIRLALDANHGYDVPDAIRLGRAAAEYDILWYEEPVVAEDKAGYAEVRARQPIPVAGGEEEFTRYGFRDLFEARGVDLAQPDLGGMGGLSEARIVATMASAFGVRCQPHVWGTPVALAASLHFLSWLPDVPGSATPTQPMLEFDRSPHPIRDSVAVAPEKSLPWIDVPDGPGLGVELRLADAEQYLVDRTVITADDVSAAASTRE